MVVARSLKLTNTLTGRKEDFQPIHPPKVSLYVCGVTVYDDCHIGHARGAVVFDVLRRTLQAKGYRVTHVRNITDVDDKIIDRARAEAGDDLKAAAQAIARKYEASFKEDFSKLGLLPPTHEPRATEFIPKMIRFIEALIKNGMAYRGLSPGENEVYFNVPAFRSKHPEEYGKLSGQRIDQLFEGARVEPGKYKRDPLDFALWKAAKPDEPSWESPWGPGRPGWHIECSTMSTDLLGDEFDIHGGGQDLLFPHHENELAQARAAGKKFARYWLHNGLLTVNNQKMSKSVGNIVRISQVLEKHPADVLRLFFLGAHYRSPLDFTWERYDEAANGYKRLLGLLVNVEQKIGPGTQRKWAIVEEAEQKFFQAMDDDLNTPEALAALFELVTSASWKLYGRVSVPVSSSDIESVRYATATIRRLGHQILGLFQVSEEVNNPKVERLIQERDEARKRKDFQRADEIRRELIDQGYVLEDTTGKTVVRKKI